ncbi:hypothetical protein SAMD00023353_0801090 [Rosellinia necatrix]|uniref:Uncharacterized protein n=1 Tax=Rosellinia necatrix TaxID=77044 RepID=A0A1S8A612_ROSNE|nr:hypothetical protein SAMD00023353_0801090 [Rosellinia necatrix]
MGFPVLDAGTRFRNETTPTCRFCRALYERLLQWPGLRGRTDEGDELRAFLFRSLLRDSSFAIGIDSSLDSPILVLVPKTLRTEDMNGELQSITLNLFGYVVCVRQGTPSANSA